MKMKRILSAILALAVALCCLCLPGGEGGFPELSVSVGAEGSGGISVSSSTVRRGEAFDIIVTVPAANVIADSVELKISYDPNTFEITEWEPGITSGSVETNVKEEEGLVILAAANTKVSLSSGLKFAAKAKVKAAAVGGNYNIRLSYYDVSNTESGYSWKADSVTTVIKVADKLVSVTGTVSLKTKEAVSGTAAVTLTNSLGETSTADVTLRLVSTDSYTGISSYTGTYEFTDKQGGETYTVQTVIPGFVTHTETLEVGSASVSADMKMNRSGDIDGDGHIGASDATHVLKYCAGVSSLIKPAGGTIDDYLFSVARVEGGNVPTVRDATQILRYAAGYPSALDNV